MQRCRRVWAAHTEICMHAVAPRFDVTLFKQQAEASQHTAQAAAPLTVQTDDRSLWALEIIDAYYHQHLLTFADRGFGRRDRFM